MLTLKGLVSKGAKHIMTSGSEQHYYLARRGNGTDTYYKSPKVCGQNLFSFFINYDILMIKISTQLESRKTILKQGQT